MGPPRRIGPVVSDYQEEPDWWQGDDGRWYPPQSIRGQFWTMEYARNKNFSPESTATHSERRNRWTRRAIPMALVGLVLGLVGNLVISAVGAIVFFGALILLISVWAQ